MLTTIWNTIFYHPLYNALVYIVSVVPFHDLGIAVIVLTIVVKLILYPFTKRSIVSQVRLRELEPEINRIKEIYPDKQEQAKKTFELYKQYNVNPFSGCLLILVQLPFIFALYYVFLKGTGFNEWALYSFVHYPAVINTMFLGLIDLHGKSIVLAVLAGISQFFQIWLVTKSQKTKKLDDTSTFKDQLAHSMAIQTKYILPIFIVFIAYKVSSAVALYWVVSNLFTIVQEILVRRKIKSIMPQVTVIK
jgi:YidC/Oxa1 family membrane protein insertase